MQMIYHIVGMPELLREDANYPTENSRLPWMKEQTGELEQTKKN